MNSQLNNEYNLTDEQIVEVCLFHKDKFFEERGFRQQRGQKLVSDAIVKNVLLGTGKEIIHEVSRQSGKTTIIVETTLFLLLYIQEYWAMLGKVNRGKFECGIFAPQREQAKTAFDRLKEGLEKIKARYGIVYEEANGNTLRLGVAPYISIVYTFPLNSTSNIESKTLDFAIFDECQKLPDKELRLKAFPMLASTNGVRVFIGTSGYGLCYFFDLHSREGMNDNTEKFIYNVYDIIEQKREMFVKTNDASYLNYEKYFKEEVEKHGLGSDYIKTQFLLDWVLERNMFVSPSKMAKMCVNIPVIKEDLVNDVFIGIDCAKESDSTVACAWRWEMYQRPEWTESKRCLRVLDWYVINKELYSDQWEVLEGEFLSHYKLYKLNIDGTGSGDGTGDWFLKKYDKITYDIFKAREANNRRGTIRPIKFTSQSKNVMYKQLQLLIDNDQVLVPIDPDGIGYNKFVLESKILLKEYKGDLLSVHHNDEEGATDDCWDALAMTCYDIDSIPLGSQPLKINKFTVKEELTKPTTRQITEEWINKKLKRKDSW